MNRCALIVALVFAILMAFTVQAAHVCKEKDCADIVGKALVRDNLGNSKHFTESHHAKWREEARQRRVEIQRREKHLQ